MQLPVRPKYFAERHSLLTYSLALPSGQLVTLVQEKHPDLFAAGYASSAPLNASGDFWFVEIFLSVLAETSDTSDRQAVLEAHRRWHAEELRFRLDRSNGPYGSSHVDGYTRRSQRVKGKIRRGSSR